MVKRLRQTRADMLGTLDEQHYWDCHDAALMLESLAESAERVREAEKELLWLVSHCRALGMTKKSNSGKLEHDVALFAADLKDAKESAERKLAEAQKDAERYRWLRDKLKSGALDHGSVANAKLLSGHCDRDRIMVSAIFRGQSRAAYAVVGLDAALDAALSGAAPEEKKQ